MSSVQPGIQAACSVFSLLDDSIVMRIFQMSICLAGGIFPQRLHRMHRGDEMSYRIEYGPAIPSQHTTRKYTARLRILTAVFLLIFVFLVRQYFPTGAENLRQFLLPGAPGVTQTALDQLMEQLRDGQSLGQALTAFCTYIVSNDPSLCH